MFINVMEPHLPYSPPDRFVQAFAPYLRENRAAQRFMHAFNRQAMHWITPAAQPFTELQARTLSDMYDAEVAYQDHLLAQLLSVLDRPEHRNNTMVLLVGDHGEMLGERQYMGHAFGVYRELVQVPLIVRWPGQAQGQRVATTVSATRVFHTVMEAAGVKAWETSYGHAMDLQGQSLQSETNQAAASRRPTIDRLVVSEAYPPEFALRAVEKHKPDLIDRLGCRVPHWGVYKDAYKLIHIQDVRDELYDLARDPREQHALGVNDAKGRVLELRSHLKTFLDQARAYRPNGQEGRQVDLEDKVVQERLRGLGYIE